MDLLYAYEKYSNAVRVLATGRGAIKDRLYEAFLELVAVSPNDVPPEIASDVKWIRAELTKRQARLKGTVAGRTWSEGNLGATLRGMRLEKAESIAARICEVAAMLNELAKDR